MVEQKILTVVGEVTKSLTPLNLNVVKKNDETLLVTIVSNQFKGINLANRLNMVLDLFQTKAHDLTTKFNLVIEAWTGEEAQGIEQNNSNNKINDTDPSFKKTAKEVEL
jgi:stress-induced morphogen